MARLIALLRAVNVGGRKLPMAELRALCGERGWEDVETYIQSGNLIFSATGKPDALETELEEAIAERFGLDVPVIVRSAAQWAAYAAANPFAKAAREEPNRLQLLVSKRPPNPGAAARLMEKAQDGEAVQAAGGALWFHFSAGIARSKLTPALIDKACGSPSTGRNWRTVMKLKEMAEA
ncbi:MAG: hypothetical protein QOG72_3196 [Sphingomonadales bacterium]|jgi:uncharacterized protein (DUF1697 family)|nr:hypothetical protein [Sphingomonadales bacterium]